MNEFPVMSLCRVMLLGRKAVELIRSAVFPGSERQFQGCDGRLLSVSAAGQASGEAPPRRWMRPRITAQGMLPPGAHS